MIVCILMTATAARAEHKLLITDVLDAKQVEAQASFEYMRLQQSFGSRFGNGRVVVNSTESRYSLGAGVGYGLEVTASIPYVFSERTALRSDADAGILTEKRDGFGDFSFGAKYSLLDEKKNAPVSLVAGLNVKFDTAGGANNPGTKTTDVNPILAVSKKLGHHHTPYASYQAVISNHGHADEHILSVGVERELNETVTFDARVEAAYLTATDSFSSSESYDLELASYLQLLHNFYLIPSVAVATGSTSHSKGSKYSDEHFGSPFGIKAGLSLYYLF